MIIPSLTHQTYGQHYHYWASHQTQQTLIWSGNDITATFVTQCQSWVNVNHVLVANGIKAPPPQRKEGEKLKKKEKTEQKLVQNTLTHTLSLECLLFKFIIFRHIFLYIFYLKIIFPIFYFPIYIYYKLILTGLRINLLSPLDSPFPSFSIRYPLNQQLSGNAPAWLIGSLLLHTNKELSIL